MAKHNQVQLITYVDRLTSGGIQDLQNLLHNELEGVFGGAHLLPFYFPIDGEDAGFDPIDHTQIDSRLGSWQDVKQLGHHYQVMADMIVNHMSAQSPEFLDVIEKGTQSVHYDLFLTKDKIFGNDETQTDIEKIYRPRPTPCFTPIQLKTGESKAFWTTFTANQIDIDINSDQGKAYLERILDTFASNNISLIRLDAAGYAVKKAGTNCFMLEDTFAFINDLSERAKQRGMQCLVEIHSHYQTQCEIAERCDLVYDFALPPLVLHTLFNQDAAPLAKWLDISPRNCVTVLDTHDGIGIIDVGKHGDKPGLLNDAQIDALVEQIHVRSQGQSRQATGGAASNLDLYQVNCTYYNALGADDKLYLIARALQFFSPGLPQVYYTGLLAIENDMALLAKTQVGRDINRAYLDLDQVKQQLTLPVVQGLIKLIKMRNTHEAFNGSFSHQLDDGQLCLCWQEQNSQAKLVLDTNTLNCFIELNHASGDIDVITIDDMLAA
ncbi:sucrose phosphorylase (plasmid) [Saccharobesus litoralis]|uniref:Sucrose phosphorylase n=1 Tax=Saccharobesus litoralis TaxID=2172099 RepID=A0A2S0VYE8_9ALTE|nr:sucrose phosphorylase [Saccharobesus litoralis]AWB69247.1 sucrose phosphorylase [Saccharobesus litoralis]